MELYSKENFAEYGIRLQFIKSLPIEYKQFNNEFVTWLSIIDVLMFNSKEEKKKCSINQITEQITEQDTEQVTEQVKSLIQILDTEMDRQEIQRKLGLSHRENFRSNYLKPALELKLIEMTIPDKPISKNQQYKLSEKGRSFLLNKRKEALLKKA